MRPLRSFLSACPLLLLLGAAPASATPIVYTLTGIIDAIEPGLAVASPPFSVGDGFSLVIEIDSAAPGTSLGGGARQYQPADAFSLVLGVGYVLQADASTSLGSVFVTDGSPRDNFQSNLNTMPGASFPPDLGVYRAWDVIMTLLDDAGATLSSNALPTELDIADWTFLRSLQVVFRNPADLSDQQSVVGTVTAVSVVPEPALAWLLAPVTLVAAGVRRGPGRSRKR